MEGRTSARYAPPGSVDRAFNALVATLARCGVSLAGSRLLEVPGRRSGLPRQLPVNLLRLDGARYLVAPRGQTQWVRNLRAAGAGTLILGRRREPFEAEELADADKEPVLRAYLRRFGWEVGRFFAGVGAGSSSEELAAIAPRHPVFRIEV